MASRATALLVAAAMAVVVVGALLPATAWAEEDEGEVDDDLYYIIVGDDDEWNLDVDYSEWAKYESFNVNDILRFKYATDGPNPHNVAWVDQASFNSCTVGSDSVMMASGDDVLQLRYAGQYFFFSSLNGDCKAGMKLSINVAQ